MLCMIMLHAMLCQLCYAAPSPPPSRPPAPPGSRGAPEPDTNPALRRWGRVARGVAGGLDGRHGSFFLLGRTVGGTMGGLVVPRGLQFPRVKLVQLRTYQCGHYVY